MLQFFFFPYALKDVEGRGDIENEKEAKKRNLKDVKMLLGTVDWLA